MPDYKLVALLIASLLGPVVLGLILLAVVSRAKHGAVLAYAAGMLVQVAAVSVSVGFNIYAATIHRNWWSDGPMWLFEVIAGILTAVLGILATLEVLPELVD